MNEQWFQNLKVGDQVLVVGAGLNRGESIGVVARFTNTQLVVKCGVAEHKYNRVTGREVGEQSYYGTRLAESTSEALEKIEHDKIRRKLQRYLQNVDVQNVPIEVAKRVSELLDPYIKRIETK